MTMIITKINAIHLDKIGRVTDSKKIEVFYMKNKKPLKEAIEPLIRSCILSNYTKDTHIWINTSDVELQSDADIRANFRYVSENSWFLHNMKGHNLLRGIEFTVTIKTDQSNIVYEVIYLVENGRIFRGISSHSESK